MTRDGLDHELVGVCWHVLERRTPWALACHSRLETSQPTTSSRLHLTPIVRLSRQCLLPFKCRCAQVVFQLVNTCPHRLVFLSPCLLGSVPSRRRSYFSPLRSEFPAMGTKKSQSSRKLLKRKTSELGPLSRGRQKASATPRNKNSNVNTHHGTGNITNNSQIVNYTDARPLEPLIRCERPLLSRGHS